MKRVILWNKEDDKSFIWYYYSYDISKAILDLDPDLCQNFPYFCNSVDSAHRNILWYLSVNLWTRASFLFFHLRALSYLWGRYDPKSEKSSRFLLVTVSFLHIESSVIPPLIALMKGFIFFFLHWCAMSNIWGHYDLKVWKFDDLTVLCVVWFIYLF